MKPSIRIALVLLATVTACAVTGSMALGDRLDIDLTVGAVEYTVDDDGYTSIQSDNLAFAPTGTPGYPALPARVVTVAIPPDAIVSDVTFSGDGERVSNTQPIRPVPAHLTTTMVVSGLVDQVLSAYARVHEEAYSIDAFAPAAVAENLGEVGLRKYRALSIRHTPWQYNPVSGDLQVTPVVRVTIDYVRSGEPNPVMDLHDTVDDERILAQLHNATEAQEWYAAASSSVTSHALPVADRVDYLILCRSNAVEQAYYLAGVASARGLQPLVVSRSDIDADPHYAALADTPQRIRYYLRDHYQSWGLKYLLILGQHNDIPARLCMTAPTSNMWVYADHYYAELSQLDSQSWNTSGSGQYAKYGHDVMDWYAELCVGRLPFDDWTRVQRFKNALLAYANAPAATRRAALFLGAFSNFANETSTHQAPPNGILETDEAVTMEAMFNDWTWPAGWTQHALYEKDGLVSSIYPGTWPETLSESNVVKRLNERGYGLLNLGGHGNHDGIFRRIWATDDGDNVPEHGLNELSHTPFFERGSVGQVTNGLPCFAFFAACLCGQWTEPNAVAKEMVALGRAVASVGSDPQIWYEAGWRAPHDGGVQSLQYLWTRGLVRDGLTSGEALAEMRRDWALAFTLGPEEQQGALALNLFGDPAIALDEPPFAAVPNLTTYRPSGWDGALVPRSSSNTTFESCHVPDGPLPGFARETYLNSVILNNGQLPIPAQQGWHEVTIDGAPYVDLYRFADTLRPGDTAWFANQGPFTVIGGRHTLALTCDVGDATAEVSETDNIYSRQYVWSALDLSPKHQHYFYTPAPDPGPTWPANVDAYQFYVPATSTWGVVAIAHADFAAEEEQTRHQMYLYEDGPLSATSGLSRVRFTGSSSSSPSPLYIVINRDQAGTTGPFFPAVNRLSSPDRPVKPYVIEADVSGARLSTLTSNGPHELPYDAIVRLHSVHLSPGWWTFSASSSTNEGIDVALFSPAATFATERDAWPSGRLTAVTRDTPVSSRFYVNSEGDFAVIVSRHGPGHLRTPMTYTLSISNDDALEQNDSLAAAYTIAAPEHRGWLAATHGPLRLLDADWYHMPADLDAIGFGVACLVPAGSPPLSLSAYSSPTGLLGSTSSSTGGLLSLSIPCDPNTPLWILVDGERAGTTYDLWVDRRPRSADDAYERNNEVPVASLPHPLWRSVSLSGLAGLARNWDDDWYRVTIPEHATSFWARLTGIEPELPLRLALHDSEHALAARETRDGVAELRVTPPPTGTLYLSVTERDARPVGADYDLVWNTWPEPRDRSILDFRPGAAGITATAVSGAVYQLEFTTNLASETWTRTTYPPTFGTGTVTFLFTTNLSSSGYYRVSASPAP